MDIHPRFAFSWCFSTYDWHIDHLRLHHHDDLMMSSVAVALVHSGYVYKLGLVSNTNV